MEETFTLSKALLLRLLDAGLPSDDDPGPWGPFGPVMRFAMRDGSWLMLNPQPLPPDPPPDLRTAGPVPDPWRVAGPGPQPWRAAMLARHVIDRLVAEAQLGEVLAGGSQTNPEGVQAHLFEFVDDYCGTRPPRWPRPWPWPPRRDPRGLDLLVAGAQFQKAADAMSDNPLQADFAAAADRFLTVGLERMQSELQ
jgi:hypothetical protein